MTAPKEQRNIFPKLSGKRTEINTYKIIILYFFFSIKRVFRGCLRFILKQKAAFLFE